MIEVRIRPEYGDPIHLMDVPHDQLDDVIPLISRWGLYAMGDDIDRDHLSAQFRVIEGAAFFEVMIEGLE